MYIVSNGTHKKIRLQLSNYILCLITCVIHFLLQHILLLYGICVLHPLKRTNTNRHLSTYVMMLCVMLDY